MEFKVGDRVMVMLGPDHPSRGTVVALETDRDEAAHRMVSWVHVKLDALWPPGAEAQTKRYDPIDLMEEPT